MSSGTKGDPHPPYPMLVYSESQKVSGFKGNIRLTKRICS